jgi:hypothetical protein
MTGWVIDVREAQVELGCEREDRLDRRLAWMLWTVFIGTPPVVAGTLWTVFFG